MTYVLFSGQCAQSVRIGSEFFSYVPKVTEKGDTGLRLVRKLGVLIRCVRIGEMFAALGIPEQKLIAFSEEPRFHEFDSAKYNAPTAIITSALRRVLTVLEYALMEQSIALIPHNGSAALHLRYRRNVHAVFAEFIKSRVFSLLSIPVIVKATAKYLGWRVLQACWRIKLLLVLWRERIYCDRLGVS